MQKKHGKQPLVTIDDDCSESGCAHHHDELFKIISSEWPHRQYMFALSLANTYDNCFGSYLNSSDAQRWLSWESTALTTPPHARYARALEIMAAPMAPESFYTAYHHAKDCPALLTDSKTDAGRVRKSHQPQLHELDWDRGRLQLGDGSQLVHRYRSEQHLHGDDQLVRRGND
jgi:hypothetical protein